MDRNEVGLESHRDLEQLLAEMRENGGMTVAGRLFQVLKRVSRLMHPIHIELPCIIIGGDCL